MKQELQELKPISDVTGAKAGAGSGSTPKRDSDTVATIAYLSILYGLSEGVVRGFGDNWTVADLKKRVYLDGTPIMAQDGTVLIDAEVEFRSGTVDQTAIAGIPSVTVETAVNLEVKYGSPVARTFTRPEVSSFDVRVSIAQLFSGNANGDSVASSVTFAIDIAQESGSFSEYGTYTIAEKISQGFQRTYNIKMPRGNSRSIRVRKITGDPTDEYSRNAITLEAIVEVTEVKLRYPHTSVLWIKYDAKTFNSVPKLEVLLDGKADIQIPMNYNPTTRDYAKTGAGTTNGVWNGQFKTGYTDNPVWHWLDLATNKRYGLGNRITMDIPDKFYLYSLAQYCDALVPDGDGGYEPRFTCNNLYLQKQEDAFKVFKDISSVFRAKTIYDGAHLLPRMDVPRDAMLVFSRANATDISLSSTSDSAQHNLIAVQYYDTANMYKSRYAYARDIKDIKRRGKVEKVEVTALGCTSEGQAQRMADYLLQSELTETELITFNTGLDGIRPSVGDVFAFADDIIAGTATSGRVKAVLTSTTLQLDRPIDRSLYAGGTFLVNTTETLATTRKIVSITGDVVVLNAPITVTDVTGLVWAVRSDSVGLREYTIDDIKYDASSKTFAISGVAFNRNKFSSSDNAANIVQPPYTTIDPLTATTPDTITASVYSVVNQGINIANVDVAWSQSKNASLYELDMRKQGNTWTTLYRGTSLSFTLNNVYEGVYQFRVRAIDPMNNASAYRTTEPVSVIGKALPPPMITDLTLTPKQFGMQADWSFPPSTLDTQSTRLHAKFSAVEEAYTTYDVAYPSSTFELNALNAHTTVFIQACLVDRYGIEGEYTDWISAEVLADPEYLLEVLSGHIGLQELDGLLSSQIQDTSHKAQEAVAKAGEANATALGAVQEARSASDSASNALSNSNVAKESAQQASAVANNAQASAEEATQFATSASALARQASSSASTAIGVANKASSDLAGFTTATGNQFADVNKAIVDGDTASQTALNAYRTSNNQALSEVRSTAETAVSANSATNLRINDMNTEIGNTKTSITTLQQNTATTTDAIARDISSVRAELSDSNSNVNSRIDTVRDSVSTLSENTTTQLTTINNNASRLESDIATKSSTATTDALSNRVAINTGDIQAQNVRVTELSATLSKTNATALPSEADTSRANQWYLRTYSKINSVTPTSDVIPDYSYLSTLTLRSESYHADGSTHLPSDQYGLHAIMYFRTIVDVDTARTVEIPYFIGDDAHAVFIDGNKILGVIGNYATDNVSIPLTMGRHVIDIICNDGAGMAGFATSVLISSQVDRMYAPRSVGITLSQKADATAVQAIGAVVTDHEGRLGTQSNSITSLTGRTQALEQGITAKADVAVVQELSARSAEHDGKLSTQADSILSLKGRTDTNENEIAKKADATALNNVYTKTETDSAIAGQVTALKAGLVTGGDNLFSLRDVKTYGGGIINGNLPSFATLTDTTFVIRDQPLNSLIVGASITITPTLPVIVSWYWVDVAYPATAQVWFKFIRKDGSDAQGQVSIPVVTGDDSRAVCKIDMYLIPSDAHTMYIGIGHYLESDYAFKDVQIEQGTVISAYKRSANEIIDDVATKASAEALRSTDARVTQVNGRVDAHTYDIVDLQNKANVMSNGLDTKASAQSVALLDGRVAQTESGMTSNSQNIVTLNNSVQRAQSTTSILDTRNDNKPPSWYFANYPFAIVNEFKFSSVLGVPNQDSMYVNTETRVQWHDQSGGNVVQVAYSNNNPDLQSYRYGGGEIWGAWYQPNYDMRTLVDTKADSSAVNNISSRVDDHDGRLTTNANATTELKGSVDTLRGQVATKAESSALSNMYTKGETDSAIAGQVNKFKAELVIGGVNALRDSEREYSYTEYINFGTFPYLYDFYESNRDKPITISFDALSTKGGGSIQVYASNNGTYHSFSQGVRPEIQGEWERLSVTIPAGTIATHNPTSTASGLEFYTGYGEGNFLTVRKVQMEVGNVATAWSPSPYDVSSAIASKASAEALTQTNATVAIVDGRVTSTVGRVEGLESSVSGINGNLATVTNTANAASNATHAQAQQISAINAIQGRRKLYKIVSNSNANASIGYIEDESGNRVLTGARSYTLVVFSVDGTIRGAWNYDVYGGGEANGLSGYDLKNTLSSGLSVGEYFVIFTSDEPYNNNWIFRDEILNCGASSAALDAIGTHCAYILVGRKDAGEGHGIEIVSKDKYTPVEYMLELVNGIPLGLSGTANLTTVVKQTTARVGEVDGRLVATTNDLTALRGRVGDNEAYLANNYATKTSMTDAISNATASVGASIGYSRFSTEASSAHTNQWAYYVMKPKAGSTMPDNVAPTYDMMQGLTVVDSGYLPDGQTMHNGSFNGAMVLFRAIIVMNYRNLVNFGTFIGDDAHTILRNGETIASYPLYSADAVSFWVETGVSVIDILVIDGVGGGGFSTASKLSNHVNAMYASRVDSADNAGLATAVSSTNAEVSRINGVVNSQVTQLSTLTSQVGDLSQYASDANKVVTLDLSSDYWGQDTYFPIGIGHISSAKRSKFAIYSALDNQSHPYWATHGAGFTLQLLWEATGYGWGTAEVNRVVNSFSFLWTAQSPIIRQDQIGTSSWEVVWVRGGGVYTVSMPRDANIIIPNENNGNRLSDGYGWADSMLYSPYTLPVPINDQVYQTTVKLEQKSQVIDGIAANYTVKIDNNGYSTGFGLVSTPAGNGYVTSAFKIDADIFSVGKAGVGNINPFVVVTSYGQNINGIVYPSVGVYMNSAYISNATITSAHIKDLSVTTAKIGDGQISSAKIGDLQVDTIKIKDNAVTSLRDIRRTAASVDKVFPIINGRNPQTLLMKIVISSGLTRNNRYIIYWRGQIYAMITNLNSGRDYQYSGESTMKIYFGSSSSTSILNSLEIASSRTTGNVSWYSHTNAIVGNASNWSIAEGVVDENGDLCVWGSVSWNNGYDASTAANTLGAMLGVTDLAVLVSEFKK